DRNVTGGQTCALPISRQKEERPLSRLQFPLLLPENHKKAHRPFGGKGRYRGGFRLLRQADFRAGTYQKGKGDNKKNIGKTKGGQIGRASCREKEKYDE